MKARNASMFVTRRSGMENHNYANQVIPVNDMSLNCGLMGVPKTPTEKILDYYTNSAINGVCGECMTEMVGIGQKMDQELADRYRSPRTSSSKLTVIYLVDGEGDSITKPFEMFQDSVKVKIAHFASKIIAKNSEECPTRPDLFRGNYISRIKEWNEFKALRNMKLLEQSATAAAAAAAATLRPPLHHPSNLQIGTTQSIASVFGKLVQIYPDDKVYLVALTDVINDFYRRSRMEKDGVTRRRFFNGLMLFVEKIEKLTFFPKTICQQMGYLKPTFCPACSEPSPDINTRISLSDYEKNNIVKSTCNLAFNKGYNPDAFSGNRPELQLGKVQDHHNQKKERAREFDNSTNTGKVRAPLIYKPKSTLIKSSITPLLQSCTWSEITSSIGLLHCMECNRIVCGACPINCLGTGEKDIDMLLKCEPNTHDGREDDDTFELDEYDPVTRQLRKAAHFNQILSISRIHSSPITIPGVIETIIHLGERHGIFLEEMHYATILSIICKSSTPLSAPYCLQQNIRYTNFIKKNEDRSTMRLTSLKLDLDSSSIETLGEYKECANAALNASKKLGGPYPPRENSRSAKTAWHSLHNLYDFYKNKEKQIFLPPVNHYYDSVDNRVKSNRQLMSKAVNRFMHCVVGKELSNIITNRFSNLGVFITRASSITNSVYPTQLDISARGTATTHCSWQNLGDMLSVIHNDKVGGGGSDIIFPNYAYQASQIKNRFKSDGSPHDIFTAALLGPSRISRFVNSSSSSSRTGTIISKQSLIKEMDIENEDADTFRAKCKIRNIGVSGGKKYVYTKGMSVGAFRSKPSTLLMTTYQKTYQQASYTSSSEDGSSCVSASELDDSEIETSPSPSKTTTTTTSSSSSSAAAAVPEHVHIVDMSVDSDEYDMWSHLGLADVQHDSSPSLIPSTPPPPPPHQPTPTPTDKLARRPIKRKGPSRTVFINSSDEDDNDDAHAQPRPKKRTRKKYHENIEPSINANSNFLKALYSVPSQLVAADLLNYTPVERLIVPLVLV